MGDWLKKGITNKRGKGLLADGFEVSGASSRKLERKMLPSGLSLPNGS